MLDLNQEEICAPEVGQALPPANRLLERTQTAQI